MDRATDFGRMLVERYVDHDLSGLAAELSYRLFLAMFPFVIFVAAATGILAGLADTENPARDIVDALGDIVPEDSAGTVERELESIIDTQGVFPLVFGFGGTLWTGSLAMAAAIKALNRIHGITDRRAYRRRVPVIVGMTALAGGLVILAVVGLIAARIFGPDIASAVGLREEWGFLTNIAIVPLSFLAVVVIATFLYWAGPATSPPFHWVTLGGLAFALVWLLGSLGFWLYIANFGSYNATYGALGGAILLLIWFYISSLAFLIGAEIDNAVREQVFAPGHARAARDDPSSARDRDRLRKHQPHRGL